MAAALLTWISAALVKTKCGSRFQPVGWIDRRRAGTGGDLITFCNPSLSSCGFCTATDGAPLVGHPCPQTGMGLEHCFTWAAADDNGWAWLREQNHKQRAALACTGHWRVRLCAQAGDRTSFSAWCCGLTQLAHRTADMNPIVNHGFTNCSANLWTRWRGHAFWLDTYFVV